MTIMTISTILTVSLIAGKNMIQQAPASKLRQNLGEFLDQIKYKRDSVVIIKDGKPVAAMIDIGLFERISAMERRFTEMTSKIQTAFAGVDEPELDSILDEAVESVRRSKKLSR